jgi:hypothetical protein
MSSALTCRAGHEAARVLPMKRKYREQHAELCNAILEIRSTLDFGVSLRGWTYIFEKPSTMKGQHRNYDPPFLPN